MKIITSLFAVLVGLCFVSSAKAQKKLSGKAQTIPYIEVIDCYKCNELVISLPSPKYPAYVASGPHIYNGRVGVQILIDESGKVETATAIYGHNYFRPMLEKEAKLATFNPKIVEEKATKTTGVIVFLIISRADATEKAGLEIKRKSASTVVNCGVCNQKAIFLPKPGYPKTALAVNVTGSVNVEVLINLHGKVRSAKAVSGHPFLRPAAVKAALMAKFTPFLLNGKPVNAYGTIVYNFVR